MVNWCLSTGCSFMWNTWNTALFSSSDSPLCSAVRTSFCALRKQYSSFDLLMPHILSLDLNLAVLFSPWARHNSSFSSSQWSCQIIAGEHSAKNHVMSIIAAIIAQTLITSLACSPLTTILTLPQHVTYNWELYSYLQEAEANSCLQRRQNNDA